MIINLIEPHDDELFFSYIYRLSVANGCCNMTSFVGRILNNETDSHKISHTSWSVDGAGLFAPFFRFIDPDLKIDIIDRCSLYPYQSLFLTPYRQAMVVNALFNKTKKYRTFVSKLSYCPVCKEEERKAYGYHYLHRAHHLPGVTVCHKHHVPLIQDNVPAVPTEDAVEYAVFSASLLCSGIDSNIDQIQKAVMKKTNVTVSFYNPNYTAIPDVIRTLMCTFGNVENLASSLEPDPVDAFVNAVGIEYVVYQPFRRSLVEMHHSCGEDFFTTPTGFLSGWKCPCTQKTVTMTFHERVAQLTGNEYTVTGTFIKQNKPVEIRHSCGHTFSCLPRHFLNGTRCPECTKIIAVNHFPKVVEYMTDGQYKVTNKRGQNIYEITGTNGRTIEMTIPQFLQEMKRPTPSEILPVKNPRLDWEKQLWNTKERPKRISKKDVYERICSIYTKDQLIFMEDLQKHFPDNYYKSLKKCVASLITDNKLFPVETGIYTLSSRTISPEDLLREKYLIRNGVRIGIHDSKTLAYEMNLSTERPDTIYIMTNKESRTHGRKRTINGFSVHIRGNNILINDDNYKYIMVLEAIKYCWHYNSRHIDRIPQFIKDNRLSLQMFMSLLPSYTKNVQKQFKSVWRNV